MMSKPKITDAVLLLLSVRPMTPEQITVGINLTDAHPLFRALRARWGGEVFVKQVYAAMSGLRGFRASIQPEGGEPSISRMYAITPHGRRELERRGYTSRVDLASPANLEAVDHPAHYGGEDNPYEVIKVVEAWKLGFNLGNTVKYIGRAPHKGATLQDLKKARWYLDREISNMEKTNA